ncbi:MAG: TonB-dependent receptor [Candidatus Omnitrophica bacterium]|nr:TonB-dependent receptor [Candidatus Omnitrophota bacterium]
MSAKNVMMALLLLSALSGITFVYAEERAPVSLTLSEDAGIEGYQTPLYRELETVVVTARRVPSDIKQTAETITVYTEEDIGRWPDRDLGEALSYIPAVDVQLNGQFGQATALSVNGSSARQVLLMVDGIPFNTQLSGQANPAQIPLEHIQRVEVIKGASSSAWGSALGGVVNVITKDAGETEVPTGNFTSSFAEFGTTKNSLDLAGKIKGLGYLLTGSYFKTDGAQYISDAEEKQFFGKLQLPLGDAAKLLGEFGYSGTDVRYALSTSTFCISQPQIARYGKMLIDVQQDGYQWNAAYKYNDQDITTDSTFVSSGALFSSTDSENVYHGISLNGSVDVLESSELVMGADFDWHRLKSNQYLDKAESINMQAPYVNYTAHLGPWDVITGLRYDHNRHFGSQVSPSVGSVYHFGDAQKTLVRARVSRAFNAPPLLKVYNDGVAFGFTILPNPDLKAERATMVELGLQTTPFEPLKMDLSAYRADVKDGIADVMVSPLTTQTQNIRKFRRQGGQLLFSYDAGEHVTLYGSGAFNDAENRATGETVRDAGIARQKFTFGGRYKNERGFGLDVSGYYIRWSSDPSSRPNDRKPIFDLKLVREFKGIREAFDAEIFLNVRNLTNSKYWSNISFPLPRRYFEGGFSMTF